MSRRKQIWIGIIALTVLLVSILGVLYLAHPTIPRSISSKANFPIYLPNDNAPDLVVNRESLKYDDQNHGVVYAVTIKGKTVTVTEQATPDTFSDGPVYAYLLQKSHQYDAANTSVGNVALTHPAELNGLQMAIVNPFGTLIFAHPEKDLTKIEWQILFNAMRKYQ